MKAPAKDQKLECVWDVMEGKCEGAKLLGARLSSIGRGRFVAPRVVLWLESTDLRMTGVKGKTFSWILRQFEHMYNIMILDFGPFTSEQLLWGLLSLRH